jgi:hypothetical protein
MRRFYKLGHWFTILGKLILIRRAPSRTNRILTGYAPLARSPGLSPELLIRLVDLDLSMHDELDSGISAPERARRKHSFHAPYTE